MTQNYLETLKVRLGVKLSTQDRSITLANLFTYRDPFEMNLKQICTLAVINCILCMASVVECGLKNGRVSPRCVMVRDALGEVIGCRNLRHLMGCSKSVSFYLLMLIDAAREKPISHSIVDASEILRNTKIPTQ